LRRWAPDPGLRRDASLLLAQRFPGDPQLHRDLLRGLGWGTDPVAAVALKNAAQNAAALGEYDQARQLWETLLHRFRGSATTADALYALGRRRPPLRAELMQRFPAHPAALAAALEAGPAPADRLAGALHLARWGARWPGAAVRLGEACRSSQLRPKAAQRASLAAGIAQLGDGDGALACLGGDGGDPARAAATSQLSASGRLDLARALL